MPTERVAVSSGDGPSGLGCGELGCGGTASISVASSGALAKSTQFLLCRKRQNPAFTSVKRGLSNKLRGNDPSLLCKTIGQRDVAYLIDKTRNAFRQTMNQHTGFTRKQCRMSAGNL